MGGAGQRWPYKWLGTWPPACLSVLSAWKAGRPPRACEQRPVHTSTLCLSSALCTEGQE